MMRVKEGGEILLKGLKRIVYDSKVELNKIVKNVSKRSGGYFFSLKK